MNSSSICGYCCATTEGGNLFETTSIFGDKFSLKSCSNCKSVFLSPRPTKDQLDTAYSTSYYGSGSKKFLPLIQWVVDFLKNLQAKKFKKLLPSSGKILDIGCGDGSFLSGLQQSGYQTFGVELPGQAAIRAEKILGENLKIGELSEYDFVESSMDLITMFHVFEHLPNPKDVLQIISKLIKPNGYLFISLPNIDSLQAKLFKGKWLHLDPPRHLFFLSPKDLIKELNYLGFECIEEGYFSFMQNPFGFQQSLLNCLCSKRELLFESLKGNIDYCSSVSPRTILLQKVFFILTFPFFSAIALFESLLKRGGTMEFVFRKVN